MKKSTIQLLFWASVAYAVLLIVVRGALPVESIPSISLVAIPLLVITVIIALDLMIRSTRPAEQKATASRKGFKESHVRTLSGQINVAANASDSYFDNVIRARLRELLVAKAAIETELRQDKIRQILSDPAKSSKLLRNERLYGLLYGPTPAKGQGRVRLIEEAVQLIGAWES